MASLSTTSNAAKYPYPYPYPSEVNVGTFVFIKLTQSNYSIWSKLMLEFLKTEGLVGFVDGTIQAPPKSIATESSNTSISSSKNDNDSNDYQAWKRSDLLVRGWIASTLQEDVLIHVVRLETAKDIWDMLKRIFDLPFRDLTENDLNEEDGKNLSRYLPLHKAALQGDWESARKFLAKEPEAVRAVITGFSETAAMVAVRSPQRKILLMKLVEMMSPADLAIKNRLGLTALHMAAAIDNIEAAKLLVDKNPELPNVRDNRNTLPLHLAAGNGQKNVVSYLLSVTKEDAETKPFEDESGVELMHALLINGFFDIALSLLQRYPKLAWGEPCPLLALAVNRSAFPSGSRFNIWQRLIYSYVPIPLRNVAEHSVGGNIKNSMNATDCGLSEFPLRASIFNFILCYFFPPCIVKEKLRAALWRITEILVPQAKYVYNKKLMHHQALHVLKSLCEEILKLDCAKAIISFGTPLRLAIHLAVHEIAEEILDSFPGASFLRSENNETVFLHAILSRHANVYNLIYQYEDAIHLILITPDLKRNNALHFAGCLKDKQQLELRASAAGPALQMQRELQWFKEVEKFMLPRDKEQRNIEGKTPSMVFTETHEELIKEGEQWMKDKANSFTFVATLVAAVAFAAAITVPGGNEEDNGLPIFSNQKAFTLFAISDALALFSSISSVIMFLSILTSRYAADDFLYALPQRLIIGLVTLFFAIIAMMVAFSSTVYLVFGDKRAWTLIPLAALPCLCIILFAFLQFPPLLVMLKSTYFPGLFGRQSDRILF